MRVLHFYKTYYPDSWGGVEQAIRQMCVGTGRLGVHNAVLTLSRHPGPSQLAFEGHTVHRARQDLEIASTGFSREAIGQLRRLARAADVVHYHFPWPFMDVAHFLARIDKPSVVTYHSDIVRQKQLLRLYAPLMRRFLGDVSAIVATSPNYLASSTVLQRFADKTRVIPFGLDRASYPQPAQAVRDKWRALAGERFFLFVGVLRYYKGLHILLDAMHRVDYPLVIVGAGPIERELKDHARRLGLRHVRFVGAVAEEDKIALLELCHALVFPSHLRSEAFGISLLEGAMFGKPMISSEIGTGTTFINSHGDTGLVVGPDDPPAFCAAMRTLWEQPARAAEMGRRAEARYRELFTVERMAQQYHALYDELASGNGVRAARHAA